MTFASSRHSMRSSRFRRAGAGGFTASAATSGSVERINARNGRSFMRSIERGRQDNFQRNFFAAGHRGKSSPSNPNQTAIGLGLLLLGRTVLLFLGLLLHEQ